MRTLKKTLTWLALTGLVTACAGAGDDATDPLVDDRPVFGDTGAKADGFALVPGSYDAQGILRVANTLDRETLDDAVALDARAARNIVEARAADGDFESVIGLDEVKYVGVSAFAKMRAYAADQGWIGRCGDGVVNGTEACDGGADCDEACELAAGEPNGVFVFGVEEGTAAAAGILAVANELSKEALDDAVGLDSRAASSIVTLRPFGSLVALDAAPYVGAHAFGKLQGWAEAHGIDPIDPEPEVEPDVPTVHGVAEGSYEALGILALANSAELVTLDIDVDLDKRAAKGIFYTRQANGQFANLAALDAVGYVGARAFAKLLAYAQAHDLLPFCGDGLVQPGEEACDGTAGCDDQCALTYHCGDGVAEIGEECDDGNGDDADGCSARCRWELKQATDTNASWQTADDVGSHTYVTGHFSRRSGAHYWRFEVEAPSRVSVDIMGHSRNQPITRAEFVLGESAHGAFDQAGGWNLSQFEVPNPYRSNNPFWTWYWDDRCSSSGCRRPDYNSVKKYKVLRHHATGSWDRQMNLQPGTYYISLHTGAGNSNYRPSLSYVMEIDIEPVGAVCGNGVVDGDEACDDGERVDNDGCSRACQWEVLPERESNDDQGRANVLNAYRRVSGSVPAGDEDWFTVHVEDGQFAASFGERCPFDGVFELYDAEGELVAEDDDGGADYCPALDLDRLPVGYYSLRLRHHDPAIAGGNYTLALDL